MSMRAPSSPAFRPKPRVAREAPSSPQPQEEEAEESKQQQQPQDEDEEIRIAMEMADLAAQNPHMSPDELRKLVVARSIASQKQAEIVEQLQRQKEQEQVQQPEEKPKKWGESLVGWAESVALKMDIKLEELQDAYERRAYAEEIENDKKCRELRKKLKFMQKTLASDRLLGNRVETDHSFKRQREELVLLHLNDKIWKNLRMFTSATYNVHVYGKAILRVNKKWNIPSDNPEELSLEALLCRNMHQMFTIKKQKSKLVQSTVDITKYLARCKMWLSDKKAHFEEHIATYSTMSTQYKDIVKKQDDIIQRLKASDEFKGVDLESVELHSSWKELSTLHQQEDDKTRFLIGLPATVATLSALKGLPINDTIEKRLAALEKAKLEPRQPRMKPPDHGAAAWDPRLTKQLPVPLKAPELVIETMDTGSVSSHLSDPDGDGNDKDL